MRNFLIVIAITEQTKVVIKFTDSFLETIDILLDLQVGNASRLEHIKKMILDNKPLYKSDEQYIQSLSITYNIGYQKKPTVEEQSKMINCRTCSSSISESAKYCPLCGTGQKRREYHITEKINPLHLIPKLRSYQILTIVGALTAMIPILFIVARMEPLLLAIEYETGRDISSMAGIFVSLGTVSSALSIIAVTITFVIKNPKKVGRSLFFVSFAILLSSIFIGIVGFIIILIASKNAYNKRHY